jgi:hypothetical protein
MEWHDNREITGIERHTQISLMNGFHLNYLIITCKPNSTSGISVTVICKCELSNSTNTFTAQLKLYSNWKDLLQTAADLIRQNYSTLETTINTN